MARMRLLTVLLAGSLFAAACGGDDDTEAASADDGAGSADREAALADDRRGEGVSIVAGFTGETDIGHLSMLEALDRMESELGYETETPYLAETELVTDSVIRGEFDFGVITAPALVAYEAGAQNIEIVGVRNPNDWAIVSQTEIESCDDLDGRTFAIHSEGSVMAAITRSWVDEACSEGAEPEEIVISGSNNRTAALISGEIDATAVQIQDLPTLEAEYGGGFTVLSPQWEENPDLVSSAVYTNRQWADENPNAVIDLLFYMTQVAREWAEDPASYEAAIRERLPDVTPTQAQVFVEDLGAQALFATNGGVNPEAMDATIDFFADAGTIEGTVTTDDILDLSYLETALDELGVDLSTESDIA